VAATIEFNGRLLDALGAMDDHVVGVGRTARSGTGFRCPDTEIRCQFVWAAGVRAAYQRGP